MSRAPIRAVLFDAYGTLFDVYSVGALCEQLFPGKGEVLTLLWREKQIDYSRIRTLSGRYKPFDAITRDALEFSCARLGLALTPEHAQRLMNQYACLAAFPEAVEALRGLKALGVPTAILSNGTPAMLEVAVKSAGMHGLFDRLLSADAVQRYKTAPQVYQLGPEAFGLAAADMLFVSSNGWDACGATWFGFQTFWINRAGLPAEALDVTPHAVGRQLTEVVALVAGSRA